MEEFDGRGKNNIFVVGVNMQGRTSEEIARETAMKIVEITDELMNRQRASEEKIKAIADVADLIVNGYAFLKNNNKIKVINLNRIEKVTILDIDGIVLTTTMDEIEVDIVLDYFHQNRKYIF